MLLVGGRLRTALATIHVPLREVPGLLREQDLLADLRLLAREVGRDFGIGRPRLAVCGLNPHAGEGGLLGAEDAEVIGPAVVRAQAEGIDAEGPLPADGCIPQAAQGRYDAVLAMYHDQALPAVKTLAPRTAVNVTLGLPFVRTSVDHGTALDVAGRGVANDSSLRAAVALALACVAARSTRAVPPPT
jgi:4-hydroxythreonine-4-phosphate dehydrogenase